jgi:hypothetical protein
MMLKFWVACACALFSVTTFACENVDRRTCKKQLSALVSYRAEAIANAFGDLSEAFPTGLKLKFVQTSDPEYALFSGRVAYDQKHRALVIPYRFFGAKMPNPLRATAYYWPFYQSRLYREEFPLIEAVDNALWGAYLQEAAKLRGLSWPHEECGSVQIDKRLPCEMLVEGIAEHLTATQPPMFNSNRLDRIWPEDFDAFTKRVWRDDAEYVEVQRYGGILLIKPLVDEFGVPRALEYFAQTPFLVEGDNLRAAALRYQQQARESLAATTVRTRPFVSALMRNSLAPTGRREE